MIPLKKMKKPSLENRKHFIDRANVAIGDAAAKAS